MRSSEWGNFNREWTRRVANFGEWRMENGEWGMGNGEWGMGNLSSEPSPLSELRRVEMDANFGERGMGLGEAD